MLSSLHIFAVIAALLICPIRCMGALPCAADGAESASSISNVSHCSCCHHVKQSSPEAEENGPIHSDDCGCASCLCHGALHSTETIPLDLMQAPLFASITMLTVDEACVSPFVDASGLDEFSPPPLQGQSLRILYQTFLC